MLHGKKNIISKLKKYILASFAIFFFIKTIDIVKVNDLGGKLPKKAEYLNLKDQKLKLYNINEEIQDNEVVIQVKNYALKKVNGELKCYTFSGVVKKHKSDSSFKYKDRVLGYNKDDEDCKPFIKINENDILENPYISMTDSQTSTILSNLSLIQEIFKIKKIERKIKILIDNAFSEEGLLALNLLSSQNNIELIAIEDTIEGLNFIEKKFKDIKIITKKEVPQFKFDYIFHIEDAIQLKDFEKSIKNFTKIIYLKNSLDQDYNIFSEKIIIPLKLELKDNKNRKYLMEILSELNKGEILFFKENEFKLKDYKKMLDFYKKRKLKNGYISLDISN